MFLHGGWLLFLLTNVFVYQSRTNSVHFISSFCSVYRKHNITRQRKETEKGDRERRQRKETEKGDREKRQRKETEKEGR